MNAKVLLLVFSLLIFSGEKIYSQFGFSHEVGVIVGPVAFYSDFGQRNDFETNAGNTGIGVGIIHYLNFAYRADCNCYTRDKYFNDHFKVRTELDYHKTSLEHYGESVEPDKTSLFADQLRATTGSSEVIELGAQLEFYPFSIRDFMAGSYKIAPFLSFGIHYVNFNPEIKSDIFPPLDTHPKYINSFQQDSGSTTAFVGSFGFRFKLTQLSDLMLDSRWHYYNSDWVDGLNPSERNNNGAVPVPENKANEWIYWLNIGYVYYLD
ncbi:THC0290_0291 family protein [Aequorivita echinoideorum]|uniref:Glutamate dehydrogenase n=1 Tax=Aequorivita echinoideorum TaxID=1549647 RepID=A0ABS5S1C6_9FLAO|nr:glutamate dehydrogenase [Aequorivita echinoideorum]MBT0607013.1 glutamate dehydrogenase [Aequorivita echinoideorum]